MKLMNKYAECLKLQEFVNTLPVQSAAASVPAAATAKKQRPVLSSRHTEDDLKSGDYKYITEYG